MAQQTTTPETVQDIQAKMNLVSIAAQQSPSFFVEFKMSGIQSHNLSQQINMIKDRSIAWDTFHKANVISVAEVENISALDKAISQSPPNLEKFMEKVVCGCCCFSTLSFARRIRLSMLLVWSQRLFKRFPELTLCNICFIFWI